MNGTEKPTRSIEGLKTARRRSPLLLTMVSLLAIIAAACGSEAVTVTADEQSAVTTTTLAVETTVAPDIEDETLPAPDADVMAFAAAFGVGDADQAWNTVSDRCQNIIPEADYPAIVASSAEENPGQVASNITAEIDGVTAAISYDIHKGSGEFIWNYDGQKWLFSDGNWYWDACDFLID